jgi:tetratricopeptide (TPR) repeat protein
MTRLEQLHQFLEDDPTDPFNIYALAIEYQKTDSAEALKLFERILHDYPNYLPVYYTLGKFYESIGNVSLASATFEAGITKAREQHEAKAQRELQSALNLLMFE